MEKMEKHLREFDPEDFFLDVDSCEIGNGSFGVVLLGQHKVFSLVALKCFSLIGTERQKKKLIKKITNEFDLLQQASHECIARVYGLVKWPFNMAIVMEYCPGGNLRELLADESVEIGMILRLRFAIEIASGLAVIHNLSSISRLIHGDLKPENVLFTQSLHCKIADFDCAKLASYTGSTTTWEKSFSDKWHMTMQYAAPEIFDNFHLKPAKEQDAYSYGVVLYVIVTRKLPYYNITDTDGFKKAVKGGLRPDCSCFRALEASLSDEERTIVRLIAQEMRRCWEKEPSSRPDLRSVRDRFQNCFANYDPAVVAEQIAIAVRNMQLDPTPQPLYHNQRRLACLHQFSAETRSFSGGTHLFPVSSTSFSTQAFGSSDVVSDGSGSSTTTPKSPQVPEYEGSDSAGSSTTPKVLQGHEDNFSTNPKAILDTPPDICRTSLEEALNSESCTSSEKRVVSDILKALKEYEKHTKSESFSNAEAYLSELSTTIQDNFQTSANELKRMADTYSSKKSFYWAQAFLKLAGDCFADLRNQSEAAVGIRMCVGGLKENSTAILEKKSGYVKALQQHVIPIMKNFISHIERMEQLEERTKALNLAWCKQFTAYCLLMIRDVEESKALLQQAIDTMKSAYGSDYDKYHVMGHCVHNLANVYVSLRRFQEALQLFAEARYIYYQARDISEEYRTQVLQKCAKNTERTRLRMNDASI